MMTQSSNNFAMKRSGVSSLNLSSLSLSSSQSSSSSSLSNAPTTANTNTAPLLSRGFGSMQSRQAEMDLTSLLAAPVTPKSTMIMATTPRGSLPHFDDMDVDGTNSSGCGGCGADNWGYFVDTPDF